MRLLLATLLGLGLAWSVGTSVDSQGAFTISGRVLDPNGSPSAGTYLQICSFPVSVCQRVQTHVDGRFEFEASRGTYKLVVFNPLGGPHLRYLKGGEGNLSWEEDDFTPIGVESTNVSGIVITLPAPTELSGLVRRSNGNPDSGVLILMCRFDSGSCKPNITDHSGRFRFVVPRNEYWILIQVPGDIPQAVYDPNAPGGFSISRANPGVIVLGATPITDVEITVPLSIDEIEYPIGSRLTFSSGTPVAGAIIRACQISNQDCLSLRTAADGVFRFSPDLDSGEYEIRIYAHGISGYYSERSPGSFSDSEADKTILSFEDGFFTDLEISIPLPLRVAGRIVDPAGGPSAVTTVDVCRELPASSCATSQSGADGRFAIDMPDGEYYVAFTSGFNERWYYHAASDGHLIGTGRRPERTFVRVPSAEAVDLQVRIPQRDLVRILIDDPHRGPTGDARVDVSACRDGWTFASFLPHCLLPTEDVQLDSGVRQVRSPLPDEPFYFRFDFDGYALPGTIWWYYDQDSPSGLTNDFARATIFSSDSPPPSTPRVSLPDLPRTVPVTLRLNPGVNLVGWPGGKITLAELARQLPELKGVVSIPRQAGQRWQAYAVGNPDAPNLESSSLWWFYVALHEPTTIEIQTPASRKGYSHYGYLIDEGQSFLVWASAQSATLERATAGLGQLNSAPRLLRWTGSSLQFDDSGLVRQGDVIQIDSPRRFYAQLPIPLQPYFVLQGPPDDHWEHIQQRFGEVQTFFWEEYGVQRNDFTVYYRAAIDDQRVRSTFEGQCGSVGTFITLVCGEPHAIAKFYFRFLQLNMSHILNRPGWLIEGAMEYAAARYVQHEQGGSGDPLALHRLAAGNDPQEQRTLDELPPSIQHWGDDPAATRLSALAVDWLVRHSGDPDSLLDVFRRVSDYFLTDQRNNHDWERAFEEAFGIEVGDFYERFAEYRANGFPLDGG